MTDLERCAARPSFSPSLGSSNFFLRLGVRCICLPTVKNGAVLMFSTCLQCFFCSVISKLLWCYSVATSSPFNVNAAVVRSSYLCLTKRRTCSWIPGWGPLQSRKQTSTVTMDVSNRHVFVAMFALNLVREFEKLEGLDVALVFDDNLGSAAHRRVLVTNLQSVVLFLDVDGRDE